MLLLAKKYSIFKDRDWNSYAFMTLNPHNIEIILVLLIKAIAFYMQLFII